MPAGITRSNGAKRAHVVSCNRAVSCKELVMLKILAIAALLLGAPAAYSQTVASCPTATPGSTWNPTTQWLKCSDLTYITQPVPTTAPVSDMRCGSTGCVFSWQLGPQVKPTDQVWAKTTARPTGTWVGASTLTFASAPRYVANGDGTLTDNQTGLMWEMQTSTCSGEMTCYTNRYTWSSTGTLADGTLYTVLIAGLNGGDYYSPSAGQVVSSRPGSCFANHCDWRIPTIAELQTIIERTASGCGSGSPCIDPAFGPTQASAYWSSSAFAGSTFPSAPDNAWDVWFGTGDAYPDDGKAGAYYARAVRSSR